MKSGSQMGTQCRQIFLLLPVGKHAVDVGRWTYPMLDGGPVLGVVDALRPISQGQVIKRPRRRVQPAVEAVSGRDARELVTLIAMLDTGVAGALEVTVPPVPCAARTLGEGHEAADADSGQVKDGIVSVVLAVDAVDAQLSAAVAGEAVRAGIDAAVLVAVLETPLAVSAVRVDGPALDEAPVKDLMVEGPRLWQRQLRGTGHDVAAAHADQVVGLTIVAGPIPGGAVPKPAASQRGRALLGLVLADLALSSRPADDVGLGPGRLLHRHAVDGAGALPAGPCRGASVPEDRINVALVLEPVAAARIARRGRVCRRVRDAVLAPDLVDVGGLAPVLDARVLGAVVGAVLALDVVFLPDLGVVAGPLLEHVLAYGVGAAELAAVWASPPLGGWALVFGDVVVIAISVLVFVVVVVFVSANGAFSL